MGDNDQKNKGKSLTLFADLSQGVDGRPLKPFYHEYIEKQSTTYRKRGTGSRDHRSGRRKTCGTPDPGHQRALQEQPRGAHHQYRMAYRHRMGEAGRHHRGLRGQGQGNRHRRETDLPFIRGQGREQALCHRGGSERDLIVGRKHQRGIRARGAQAKSLGAPFLF